MTAFVLGNGQSRESLDLTKLILAGPIYGCNALYRDFTPTVLVATDRLIGHVIQDSGYAKNNMFYTRHVKSKSGARRIPEQYYTFSSGPVAVALAALAGNTNIYLLGFDMGPDQQGRFNNVYAGTEFYKSADSEPTYTGNWINQIATILKDFPRQNFIRVHGPTTTEIPEFAQQSNMEKMDIIDFVARINNTKDQ